MNILFTKIFFLTACDIFLTGMDFVDAFEIGYFDEWYDEIDNDIDEIKNNDYLIDEGSGMIKCPYCENKKRERIYQQDKDLIGISDYGRLFKCLDCKKTFYIPLKIASNNEIYNFKKVMT